MFAFFPARQWDDQMLSDACRLVLDEIYIPPGAEGGMVEYKRTLIISLLFKFYLKVRRGLNKMVNDLSESLGPLTFWVGVCTWKGFPCLLPISIKGTEFGSPFFVPLLLFSFTIGLRRGQSWYSMCPVICITSTNMHASWPSVTKKPSVSKS